MLAANRESDSDSPHVASSEGTAASWRRRDDLSLADARSRSGSRGRGLAEGAGATEEGDEEEEEEEEEVEEEEEDADGKERLNTDMNVKEHGFASAREILAGNGEAKLGLIVREGCKMLETEVNTTPENAAKSTSFKDGKERRIGERTQFSVRAGGGKRRDRGQHRKSPDKDSEEHGQLVPAAQDAAAVQSNGNSGTRDHDEVSGGEESLRPGQSRLKAGEEAVRLQTERRGGRDVPVGAHVPSEAMAAERLGAQTSTGLWSPMEVVPRRGDRGHVEDSEYDSEAGSIGGHLGRTPGITTHRLPASELDLRELTLLPSNGVLLKPEELASSVRDVEHSLGRDRRAGLSVGRGRVRTVDPGSAALTRGEGSDQRMKEERGKSAGGQDTRPTLLAPTQMNSRTARYRDGPPLNNPSARAQDHGEG
eukprot:3734483-Rhodomonas_salina.1